MITGNSRRPYCRRTKRLRRLGPIDRNGAQEKQPQARFGQQFVFLVSVDQRALLTLKLATDASGQQSLKAIQQTHFDSGDIRVLQRRFSHPAKLSTAAPAITKRQTKVIVDLFKCDFVTAKIFVEIAADLVGAPAAFRK